QLDATLEAGLDFAGVLLDPAERLDREVLGNDGAAAREPDLAAALDVPVGDEAAGDVAEAADLEHLADLDVSVELFADLRREQAGKRLLEVVEDLVDDAVEQHLHAPLLRHRPGRLVAHHVEPDD